MNNVDCDMSNIKLIKRTLRDLNSGRFTSSKVRGDNLLLGR